MKDKKFIWTDDGKIKHCYENYAKMSILECAILIDGKELLRLYYEFVIDTLKKTGTSIIQILTLIVAIIFFIPLILYRSQKLIKYSKETVKNQSTAQEEDLNDEDNISKT